MMESILGHRLIGPKVAAGILALYAVLYATLLLVFTLGLWIEGGAGWVMLGLLVMATTPFFALVHLTRATTPDSDPPARPIMMTLVMAVPAVFWLYLGMDDLSRTIQSGWDEIRLMLLVALVPGFLSLWLCVTFGLLAYQNRKRSQHG